MLSILDTFDNTYLGIIDQLEILSTEILMYVQDGT